jgi:hypothetical protein
MENSLDSNPQDLKRTGSIFINWYGTLQSEYPVFIHVGAVLWEVE